MNGAISRFMTLASRGRPAIPKEAEPEDAANALNEEIDTNIKAIMTDADMAAALIDLIDSLAADSNAMMSAGRRDHTDMLFHHGAYVRLGELKMELRRLAGLTGQ